MDIGGTKGLGFGCTLESRLYSFQCFTRLCESDEQCEEHEEPQHGKGETRRQQSRRMEPNSRRKGEVFWGPQFWEGPLFGY